jgi:taurine dioxygenase
VKCNFDISPMTGTIGAEINGVDVGSELDASTIHQLRSVLYEHQVLFFRDQKITPMQQRQFGECFGKVLPGQVEAGGGPAPGVTVLASADPKGLADIWHTDHTFAPAPPSATMLYCLKVPSRGGDTVWTSMFAAYDALSEPLRAMLDGLTATHTTDRMMPRVSAKVKDVQFRMDRRQVVHPVVAIHPQTGRKILFVNPYYTSRINELSPEESDGILALLYAHSVSPMFQVRFSWRPGSMAVWDQRSTMHYAVADYNEERVMHRLMIEGETPVGAS